MRLIQYVRNRKGQRIGCVTAGLYNTNEIHMGWSQCAISKGDRFNRQFALLKAIGREQSDKHFISCTDLAYDVKDKMGIMIPTKVLKCLSQMLVRANKYFFKYNRNISNSTIGI